MALHESQQKDYLLDRKQNVSMSHKFSSGYWCCRHKKENFELSFMSFFIMSLLFSFQFIYIVFYIYFIIIYFKVGRPVLCFTEFP